MTETTPTSDCSIGPKTALLAIAFTALMVLSIPAMTVSPDAVASSEPEYEMPSASSVSQASTAFQEGDNGTTIDDFEDGDLNIDTTGWSGWDDSDGNLVTTSSGPIDGDHSGQIGDNEQWNNVWANADSSIQADRVGTKFRVDPGIQTAQFRVHSGSNQVIRVKLENEQLAVSENGAYTNIDGTVENGEVHAIEFRSIDYSSNTFELWVDNVDLGTYDFESGASSIDAVSYNIEASSGEYFTFDSVEVNGSPYGYENGFEPFSSSFDNEPADTGVPENFEAVQDPRGMGHSRNVDVEEVQTDRFWAGGQAYYAEESQDANAVTIRPDSQPYLEPVTNRTSIVLNRPGSTNDPGSGKVHLAIYEETGTDPNIEISHREGALKHRTQGGGYENITTDVNFDEWVRVEVRDIDVQNNTFTVEWTTDELESGTEEGLQMWNDMDEGYTSTVAGIDDSGYIDSLAVGTEGVTLEQFEATVVDQNGDPVPNATVQQTHYLESGFDPSDPKTLEEQARELEQEITNVYPDQWSKQLGLPDSASPTQIAGADPSGFDWDSHQDTDGQYVLTFNDDAFDYGTLAGSSIAANEISGSTAIDQPPDLILDEDGPHVLSVWEPGTGGDNQIDNSYPGGLVSDSAVYVERLSPTGEVTETRVVESDKTIKIKHPWPVDDVTRDIAETNLNPGHFYRLSPMDDPDGEPPDQAGPGSIVVAVGNPSSFVGSYQEDLRDRRGRLTDRAERIRGLLEQDTLQHETDQADANGTVSIRPPSDAVRTTLVAHKGPDEVIQLVREDRNLSEGELPTVNELQSAAKGDLEYNGSVAVSSAPSVVTPDSMEDVEVEVRSVDYKRWGDLEDFEDLQRWLEDLAMGDMAELPPGWEEDLQNLNETQLRTLHRQLQGSVIGLPDGVDRFTERFGIEQPRSTSELQSEAELRESIVRLATVLETQPSLDPCSGTDLCGPNVEDGLLSMEIPISGAINESATNVMLHWSDGSAPEPMGSDYWSIEEDSSFNPFNDGHTLVIEEFPIEERADGRALADVRPAIVMDEGDEPIRKPNIPVQNPAFSGSIPEIDAWDLNKLRPGPDERVTAYLRTQDGSFGGIRSAQAFDPDGNELSTTLSNGQVSFNTAGEGAHTLRVTYTDTTGAEFTDSLRIRARDEAVSQPPTVRWERGMGSDVAVVGSDLRSARINHADGSTDITVIRAENPIGQLHVHAEEQISGGQDVTLSVLKPNEQNINTNVNVNLHTSITASTLLYRDGEAMTHGSETANGRVRQITGEAGDREKRVIETYTNADGTLELETVADPWYTDRLWHWLDYGIPIPSLSSLGLAFGWVLPVGFAVHRRRRHAGGVGA